MALDLTNLNLTSEATGSSPEILAGVIAFIASIMVLAIIISIGLYIYTSFVYMAIGRKAKLKTPELSWIPGVGPLIIAFKTSKMHWCHMAFTNRCTYTSCKYHSYNCIFSICNNLAMENARGYKSQDGGYC